MDIVVADATLGLKWWKSTLCSDLHRLQYELISRPRKISEEKYARTQCGFTAEILWFCLTSQIWPEGAVACEHTCDVPMYISCHDDEHVFILFNKTIYHSWWDKFALISCPAPEDMLDNIKRQMPFELPLPNGTTYNVNEYQCYTCTHTVTNNTILHNYQQLRKLLEENKIKSSYHI